ncbi:uncharacterized protein LOC125951654 [Anopheles darlingi]|uniref:uncharacterized protein LOC125951654 n=1 Tax=Anopheles darlingi TaxID=43151 RepID=UPI0021006045|nr:uncharacterized protein LOC125951654 [Anopheles darlingi]
MKLLVLSVMVCALVAGSSAQSPSIAKIQDALGAILGQMSILPNTVRQVIAGVDSQNNINKALAAITAVKAQYPNFSSTYTSAFSSQKRTKFDTAVTDFRSAITNLESALQKVPVDTTALTNTVSAVEGQFMNLATVFYTQS